MLAFSMAAAAPGGSSNRARKAHVSPVVPATTASGLRKRASRAKLAAPPVSRPTSTKQSKQSKVGKRSTNTNTNTTSTNTADANSRTISTTGAGGVQKGTTSTTSVRDTGRGTVRRRSNSAPPASTNRRRRGATSKNAQVAAAVEEGKRGTVRGKSGSVVIGGTEVKGRRGARRRSASAAAADTAPAKEEDERALSRRPSKSDTSASSTQDEAGESKDGERVGSRRRRRRSRSRTPSVNRSFATYMDEMTNSVLLEQREVISLAKDIRAGVEVENAQRVLSAELERRPTLAELGERLECTPTYVRDSLLRGTAAKNRLVAANLRLVTSIARRISFSKTGGAKDGARRNGSSSLALEDMIQEGAVGLIRAAEKYDASRGYKFSTYATWWIRAAVMRAITTQSRSIRVPSTVVDEYSRIKKEYERQRNGGVLAPTENDVAGALGITAAKLRFVVSVVTRAPTSLDVTVGAPGEAAKSTLGELVEGDDRVEEQMVETMQRKELDGALKLALKPIERAAVRLRFGLDDGHPRTLREIGLMLGLSKERVRQLVFRALGKLNTPEIRATLQEYLA